MNVTVTSHDGAPRMLRPGVPVWRAGKPDALLAGAVDVARAALLEAVDAAQIGAHVAAKSEGERLVTHLFESLRPGYRGWHWFVTVARVSRSKVVTVSELGLLPSEDSVLAPEWVPWSERVRPEDSGEPGEEAAAELEAAEFEEEADDDEAAGVVDVDEEDLDEDELDEDELDNDELAAAEEEAVEAADAEAAGITDIDDEID
ncbi:DUF3027 domain-containing protein [Sinomonas sp. ASV322]|uniref:DUF3027 domain-containing protein n=1 Tax=Sinomonas sp. ASV322 TaxID=3041920 RepID=UPI0027DE4E32|nr:DUF3027 domain-containing protein [Sinomonas sp. ASV322]MDQ4503180.1 DUF3027 domain-containing protein [Sinomonas sp. ASV322]